MKNQVRPTLLERLRLPPNEVWRMLGLWLGGGVDEGSELLWVRAVATASAACRANCPACAGSLRAWRGLLYVTRRSIFAGVVCGELVMLAGKWWLG